MIVVPHQEMRPKPTNLCVGTCLDQYTCSLYFQCLASSRKYVIHKNKNCYSELNRICVIQSILVTTLHDLAACRPFLDAKHLMAQFEPVVVVCGVTTLTAHAHTLSTHILYPFSHFPLSTSPLRSSSPSPLSTPSLPFPPLHLSFPIFLSPLPLSLSPSPLHFTSETRARHAETLLCIASWSPLAGDGVIFIF